MENGDWDKPVYLADIAAEGTRFTDHHYEGPLVYKSWPLRCFRLAIALGGRFILRRAALREEVRFTAIETIAGHLHPPSTRFFSLGG
jgi:hypothetical protein